MRTTFWRSPTRCASSASRRRLQPRRRRRVRAVAARAAARRRAWLSLGSFARYPDGERYAEQIRAQVARNQRHARVRRAARGEARSAAGAFARNDRAVCVQVGRLLSRRDEGDVDGRLSSTCCRRSTSRRSSPTANTTRSRRARSPKRSRTGFADRELVAIANAGHVANADNPAGLQRAVARVPRSRASLDDSLAVRRRRSRARRAKIRRA